METKSTKSFKPETMVSQEGIKKVNVKVSLVYQHQTLINLFEQKIKLFKGGQLSLHCDVWKLFTSDREILQMVKGDVIEFDNDFKYQHNCKNPPFTGRKF